MLGIDAAELSLIRDHPAELPLLSRWLEEGGARPLASPADRLTGAVWPTFYSGTPPGSHGLYHHLQWDPDGMRLRRPVAPWLDPLPFWVDLERAGARVAVVDPPMLSGCHLERGVEVINWGAHDCLGRLATRPRSLAREVLRRFGRHPMGREAPVPHSPRRLRRIHRGLLEGIRRKAELAQWVLEQREWDFFLTAFGETHRGGHLFWPARNGGGTAALLTVYRKVEEALEPLVELARRRDARVVIFALHGMGSNTAQDHLMPAVLERFHEVIAGEERSWPVPSRAHGVMRWLRASLPPAAQEEIAARVPLAFRDWVVDRSVTGGHRWDATPAFALLPDLAGYVRLNLRGREREGALGAGAAADYVERLRPALSELRRPDGQPLVQAIESGPLVFPGERSHLLPDLVVRWRSGRQVPWVRSERLGRVAATPASGRTGNHRSEGFAALPLSGPGDRDLESVEDGRTLSLMVRRWLGVEPSVGAAR